MVGAGAGHIYIEQQVLTFHGVDGRTACIAHDIGDGTGRDEEGNRDGEGGYGDASLRGSAGKVFMGDESRDAKDAAREAERALGGFGRAAPDGFSLRAPRSPSKVHVLCLADGVYSRDAAGTDGGNPCTYQERDEAEHCGYAKCHGAHDHARLGPTGKRCDALAKKAEHYEASGDTEGDSHRDANSTDGKRFDEYRAAELPAAGA